MVTYFHIRWIDLMIMRCFSCLSIQLFFDSSYYYFRSQNAEERMDFSSIVDELLEIVNDLPNSRNMEVRWFTMLKAAQ